MSSLRLTRSSGVAARPACRSRRAAVRVSAWAGDNKNIFSGLLRIFTPNKYIDSKEDWENTGSNFTGKISHKAKKPFADGYINKLPKTEQATTQPSAQEEGQEGPIDYLNEAAERVVGHNFKGDSTEPDWSKTGNTGYKGTTRRPKEEGFHARKL